jgi:protein-S-isoprenylcysteine O-methyltransferase Ste14
MLWIRGFVFTLLVPFVLGYVLPAAIDASPAQAGRIRMIGLLPIAVGTTAYASCFIRFVIAGGTPAIFFSRPLRFLIGEEPAALVSTGLYRFSRNPMYVGVLLVVFGQAILFASGSLAVYGCALWAFFYMIVVFAEEPHLRATSGHAYEAYCRTVPRWFGRPHYL